MIIERICSKCSTSRPIEQFYVRRTINKRGEPVEYRQSYCRTCYLQSMREWNKAHPTNIKAAAAKYRANPANRAKIAAQKRAKNQARLIIVNRIIDDMDARSKQRAEARALCEIISDIAARLDVLDRELRE